MYGKILHLQKDLFEGKLSLKLCNTLRSIENMKLYLAYLEKKTKMNMKFYVVKNALKNVNCKEVNKENVRKFYVM